jgi:hypothetical protein
MDMLSRTKNAISSPGNIFGDFKKLFSDKPNKVGLSKFIEEIKDENAEYMSYQKEFDPKIECNETFEQLSLDRILYQANQNIYVLRSFEAILDERLVAFNKFYETMNKARPSFEVFQSSEASMRHALDAFNSFTEQVTLFELYNDIVVYFFMLYFIGATTSSPTNFTW